MDKLLFIGKVVNTHGIKGEIRIISDFKYKNEVFKINNLIYINNNSYIIKSYRKHKNYDMITLDNINDINIAYNLKGNNVYIKKDDYNFSGILDEDLIGMEVYDKDIYKGKVIEILKSNKYDFIVVDGIKRHLIPNIPEFIKNIDINKNKIIVNYIRGLDNEN